MESAAGAEVREKELVLFNFRAMLPALSEVNGILSAYVTVDLISNENVLAGSPKIILIQFVEGLYILLVIFLCHARYHAFFLP